MGLGVPTTAETQPRGGQSLGPTACEHPLRPPYLGPGLMGPLVWGTDRMLACGAEEMEVQLSAPENTCRLLPALSIKFTLEK